MVYQDIHVQGALVSPGTQSLQPRELFVKVSESEFHLDRGATRGTRGTSHKPERGTSATQAVSTREIGTTQFVSVAYRTHTLKNK